MDDDVLFVPVTSRSVEQYARLSWPEGLRPELAVVTNGAILLDHDCPLSLLDEEPDVAVLEEAVRRLSAYPGLARVVDCRYAYLHLAADRDPEQVRVELPDGLRLMRAGRKFYCVPRGADKETAVRRLAGMLDAGMAYAAGDGSMDAVMLSLARHAVVPSGGVPGLAPSGDVLECPAGMRFQDFVVSVLGNRLEHFRRDGV